MTAIRHLSLADAASVYSLRCVVDEAGPLGPPQKRAEALLPQGISASLSASGCVSFGAFTPNGLIGTAFIAPTPSPFMPNWLSLFGVAVHPEFRRTGLGRALTQACISHAIDCGAEGVLLELNVPNPGAQRIYESLGFEFCGDPEEEYCDAGIQYKTFTMKKLIQRPGRGDAA